MFNISYSSIQYLFNRDHHRLLSKFTSEFVSNLDNKYQYTHLNQLSYVLPTVFLLYCTNNQLHFKNFVKTCLFKSIIHTI